MTTIDYLTSDALPEAYLNHQNEPLSALDFPDNDFKENQRHRANLSKKTRERAFKAIIQKKIKQAENAERLRIKQLSKKNNNKSDQEEQDSDASASSVKSAKSTKSNKSSKSTSSTKKQQRNANDDSSAASSASEPDSETDTKPKKSATKAKKQQPVYDVIDRSNKRASRHRRPEDEPLAVEQPLSSAPNSEDEDSEDEDDEEEDELDLHYRFKHNLKFKTDDDGIMASPTIPTREWKQIVVKRLDDRDEQRKTQNRRRKD